MTAPRDELPLVLLAQAGDLGAEDELFRRVQEPLHRFIRATGLDADGAREVLQEVFLRMHAKLPWLRDPALFRPWMWRIATNETTRFLSRGRRHRHEPLDAGDESLASPPSREEVARVPPADLRAALDSISPASRAVIALAYFEELALSEVAVALEIPLGTVKSRLAYGLAALRRVCTQKGLR